VHVHGIAEIADNPLGAQATGFLFVGVATLHVQQLLFPDRHAAPANPVVTVPGVNVIEIGQRDLECDNSQNIRSLASRILELID
jgi:hypothetical protein